MSQFARPTSPDVAVNGWTTTPLYEQINEETYSDTDYIQYNSVAYCEVTLSSLSDPVSSSGHYVRYRLGRSRTDRTLTVVVRLMEGSTERASWTHLDPGASFQPFEQTLTTGEADSITSSGYADLRLRFDITAIQNTQVYCQVSWAEMEVPDAGIVERDVSEAETVTVSATPVIGGIPNPSKSETLTVSTTALLAMEALSLIESGTITVSDLPDIEITSDVTDLEASESETVTVSELASLRLRDMEALVAEGITVSDLALLSLADLIVSENEGITVSDTVVMLIEALSMVKAESVSIADDPTVQVESEAGPTLGISITSDNIDYWKVGVVIVGG